MYADDMVVWAESKEELEEKVNARTSELAAALEGKLRAAVLIGTDAEAIADAIDTVMPVYFARDMDDAVCQAASYAESDDTVLLAPACASFDQFENYGARGDAFSTAVGALSR